VFLHLILDYKSNVYYDAGMEIADGVDWFGIVDPQARSFFGREFSTPLGTTYNSYLIRDKRSLCVAALNSTHVTTFTEQLEGFADLEDIDYLVLNQIELNDGAAMRVLRLLMPAARLLVPEGITLPRHPGWEYLELRKGRALSLGADELTVVDACGVPWPDSMVMYLPGKRLLLSQSLFSQHWAGSHRFDDRIDRSRLSNQAMRYYVSLLAPAYGDVRKIIDTLGSSGIEIEVIAPSNGVIWRRDPAEIVESYARWTERQPERRAVIVYETMLKSTEYMAEAVARGVMGEGVPCSLLRASLTDRQDLLWEIFRSQAVLLGSPTVHRQAVSAFTPLLKAVKPLALENRIGAVFGSYGWSGGAGSQLEKLMRESGISVRGRGVYAAMRPSAADLDRCQALGRGLAKKLTAP
jgi:anaerobic nitric oxide reductase flavorubredoxin